MVTEATELIGVNREALEQLLRQVTRRQEGGLDSRPSYWATKLGVGWTDGRLTDDASQTDTLTYAFEELLWISEAPNRDERISGEALELAERAREACGEIERRDAARQKASA